MKHYLLVTDGKVRDGDECAIIYLSFDKSLPCLCWSETTERDWNKPVSNYYAVRHPIPDSTIVKVCSYCKSSPVNHYCFIDNEACNYSGPLIVNLDKVIGE
jgi:hypothetical protein